MQQAAKPYVSKIQISFSSLAALPCRQSAHPHRSAPWNLQPGPHKEDLSAATAFPEVGSRGTRRTWVPPVTSGGLNHLSGDSEMLHLQSWAIFTASPSLGSPQTCESCEPQKLQFRVRGASINRIPWLSLAISLYSQLLALYSLIP